MNIRGRVTDHFAEWRDDARYGLRTLARNPGFAIVSLLTLALAIGANTAVFSVARAVLLAPLPYGDPARVMRVYTVDTKNVADHNPFSPADFIDVRAQQHSFSGFAAMEGGSSTWVPEHGDPEILSSLSVTPNMFDVLRVPAAYGRTFAGSEDEGGRDNVVVIGYRLWQRAFGGDRSAIGRRMLLGGRSYAIIGVAPRGFTLGMSEDLYLPLSFADAMADPVRSRKQYYVHAIARLAPNVSTEAANADLSRITAGLAAQYPEADADRTAVIVPMHEAMTGQLRPALLLLQAAALVVLLIACANLTNLALSRALGRRRELAVRAALGAGRSRLVTQMLTESLILACAGGLAGVALAVLGTRTLLALNPGALPSMFDARIDVTVLAFSLAASLSSGLLCSVAPALGVTQPNLHDSLKEGARGASSGRGTERLRQTLVVAQVGLAVMLLVGSGLLIRSFAALLQTSPGFAPDHVLTAQLRAAGARYDSAAAVNRFYDDVLREVAATPGVTAAGAATLLPTQGRVGTTLRIEGQPADEAHLPDLGYLAVRGEYFRAMRTPLLSGRLFENTDRADGPPVALFNATAARRYFPAGNAVGARIRIGPDPRGSVITIIGVVGDIRDQGLGAPVRPTIIMDHVQQAWDRTLSLVVRTTGAPTAAIAAVRRAVRDADPRLAIRNIESLDDVVGASLAPRRFSLGLVTSFAALALVLAAIGIYGVLSYAVTTHTREFGIRIALGASTRSVLLLVARQGLRWSLAGMAIGVTAAAAAGRVMTGLLYGIAPLDAWTYATAVGVLLGVALVACTVPALRATRVDPLTSIRAE
ncbi:MAG TPA: ABC transporter permease [Gemmatimonadaceae bacterium]|nr:ABC transporter permease [Gemmatimonadaceae bacterium]